MSNFKYFSDGELAGLVDNLPAMLDMARGLATQAMREATGNSLAEVPFILTFTTGGQHCGDSTHYKGLAVDIGLGHLAEGFERDTQRWAILLGLYGAKFKRVEVCPLHIHADIGQPPEYVSPTCWIGQDA